jgi:hypothetical protein
MHRDISFNDGRLNSFGHVKYLKREYKKKNSLKGRPKKVV